MGEKKKIFFFKNAVPSLLLYNFLTDRQRGKKKTSFQLEKNVFFLCFVLILRIFSLTNKMYCFVLSWCFILTASRKRVD